MLGLPTPIWMPGAVSWYRKNCDEVFFHEYSPTNGYTIIFKTEEDKVKFILKWL